MGSTSAIVDNLMLVMSVSDVNHDHTPLYALSEVLYYLMLFVVKLTQYTGNTLLSPW